MRFKGVKNSLTQPIYDTMQLAVAAGQTVSFFSVPFGGAFTAAIVKDYRHTNLVQAGRLEKGLEIEIEALSFIVKNEVDAATAVAWADYTMIYNSSHLNLQIGQVSFLRLPLTQLPPGPGETDYYSNIAAAVTEFKAGKGIGSINNVFKLPNVLILEDQESIQVDLFVGGTPSAVTDVQLVLWGTQTRPVR
jgi:hypothetical protein